MARQLAKSLRKQMTDAERRLWYRLRAHRFEGLKFKRQVPIGKYIVDFANLRAKVVIEIDGGQHAESKTDRVRDQFLSSQGFRVVRFWNNGVLQSTDEILDAISAAIGEAAQPPLPARRFAPRHPLPVGERGNKAS
jgi:very-short-patch-repair endonuclease